MKVEPIKGISYYMDNRLNRDLDKNVKSALTSKDEDYVLIIDGRERTGKSTLAFQIAKYVDPTFDINRICFNPDEFRHCIVDSPNRRAIVYDEAYRGLGSTSALSEVNKILKGMMMEMGQKNLFVIVVLPTFYLLEKYVALWRARCLIHVFRSHKRKGYWRLYNTKKKQLLYNNPLGKRYYSYSHIKTGYKGRFYTGYVVNEDEYKKKKINSFKGAYKRTKQERFKEQRDKLLYIFHKYGGESSYQIAEWCKLEGIHLRKSAISEIITKIKDTNP